MLNSIACELMEIEQIGPITDKPAPSHNSDTVQDLAVYNSGNHSPSGVMIKLFANGQVLRSFISYRSFVNMQLSVGDKVFAIFKAL